MRYNDGMANEVSELPPAVFDLKDTYAERIRREREATPLLSALRDSEPVRNDERKHLPALIQCVLFVHDEGGGHEFAEEALREHARPQAFFANLNAETLKPHYGDVQRQVVQEILKRAAEAGLYEANT